MGYFGAMLFAAGITLFPVPSIGAGQVSAIHPHMGHHATVQHLAVTAAPTQLNCEVPKNVWTILPGACAPKVEKPR